ncbi:MAG: TonB-dependent receptor [Sphingobium sp.]|nr:TonB-dependent receptor [Sphingobium sp.]
MMIPSAAYAQATSAQNEASDTSSDGLGEIIVTANRRAENQQRVPIVVSTFQAETLTKLSIASTSDLPQLTPGLSFTRTLVAANPTLRGVGTLTSGYTAEVPVATYIDGLYLPNPAAAAFAFNNIERIEVLKGPQGTLYGRNTTGGLIHVITKEPDLLTTSIDASATYERFDTVRLNFYGSTPLGDTLAANVAVSYTKQSDGWGYNQFLGEDVMKYKDFGVQGKLLWEPTSDTRISLRGFYDRVVSDQGNFASILPGSIGNDGTPYLGEYQVSSRRQLYVKQRMYTISLKAEHDFGGATFTSITGYIDSKSPSYNTQGGVAGNPVGGQSAINVDLFGRAKTFSQEIQLASNATDSKLQWITGLFFYDDDTTIQANIYGTCVGTVCAGATPVQIIGNPKTQSTAAFGEGTYSFTPSTRLTLGLRYTRDKKTLLDGSLGPLAGRPNSIPAFPPSVPSHPSLGDIDTSVIANKLTWKIVLAQDFGPNIHSYASFNRGFKSGGYNPISFSNPPSRPEELDAYEIGIKSELFDRKLRLNIAGFYYDYKDIQLRTTAPPAPAGGSILYNAAKARVKGVDVDFVFSPVRNLTINGGAEYLDAKYKSFPGGTCTTPRVPDATMGILGGVSSTPCDLAGARLPSAPKFSYTLGVTYAVPTDIGEFEFNANDGYKSKYYWDPDNRISQKSYHLVNASLTWTHPNERYSLQGFVKNLTGTYYYAVAVGGSGGNDVHVPGAPRTYGVTARYRF